MAQFEQNVPVQPSAFDALWQPEAAPTVRERMRIWLMEIQQNANEDCLTAAGPYSVPCECSVPPPWTPAHHGDDAPLMAVPSTLTASSSTNASHASASTDSCMADQPENSIMDVGPSSVEQSTLATVASSVIRAEDGRPMEIVLGPAQLIPVPLTTAHLPDLGPDACFQPAITALKRWAVLPSSDLATTAGVWWLLETPISFEAANENPYKWFVHSLACVGFLGVRLRRVASAGFMTWLFKCPVRRDAARAYMESKSIVGVCDHTNAAKSDPFEHYAFMVRPDFLDAVYDDVDLTPELRRDL